MPRKKPVEPYMGRDGFHNHPHIPTAVKKQQRYIKQAETWILEMVSRGATLPEAMWETFHILRVAAENARSELVRQNMAESRKQREKA